MTGRVRKPGGGRKSKETECPGLAQTFDKVVGTHTAGCPVKGIRWTYLSIGEIRQKLKDKGIVACREVVYVLLRKAGMGRRKMAKRLIMKSVAGRNEQFERINRLKQYYLSRGYAVLSIDTKKKEYLGPFYRAGSVFAQSSLPCYDHDFPSFAAGKLLPGGIYDLGRNEGFLFLNTSADTAEFIAECLKRWWENYGHLYYDPSWPILIMCDGGGSNASNSILFKVQIQRLADQTGLKFRLVHFPPYCSKYNPIEHRFSPTITRVWSGIMLDSAKTACSLVQRRAVDLKSGLKVFTQIIQRTFEPGKKGSRDLLNNCNIQFDKKLSKWNYRIYPVSINR